MTAILEVLYTEFYLIFIMIISLICFTNNMNILINYFTKLIINKIC